MPVRMESLTATFVDADAGVCAGADDDVTLDANTVASALRSNQLGLRIDYLVHDEEGQLDQLQFAWNVIVLNKTS